MSEVSCYLRSDPNGAKLDGLFCLCGAAIDVGKVAHEMSGFVEKVELFRSAFDGAWLGTMGAQGDEIVGDDSEEVPEKFGPQLWVRICGEQIRGPLAKGVEGALKTQALQRRVVK